MCTEVTADFIKTAAILESEQRFSDKNLLKTPVVSGGQDGGCGARGDGEGPCP